MFIMGGGYLPGTITQSLGALAVLLATINVAGGFMITKRMLDMFKRKQNCLVEMPGINFGLSQVLLTLQNTLGCMPFLV
jgi:NAD/NADP transhydrogenase alpha subunit